MRAGKTFGKLSVASRAGRIWKGGRVAGSGFTMLELMIVVAIMGLIATMGVPMVYRIWHQEPLRKAVTDVFEVCSYARSQAILHSKVTQVVFHPREGRLEFAGGGAPAPGSPEGVPEATVPVSAAAGSSAQFADSIFIEDLDINKVPGGFRDAEAAYVRFFPNGTCDEMSLVIRYENHWRQIKLEVSTGLATVETDAQRFK